MPTLGIGGLSFILFYRHFYKIFDRSVEHIRQAKQHSNRVKEKMHPGSFDFITVYNPKTKIVSQIDWHSVT